MKKTLTQLFFSNTKKTVAVLLLTFTQIQSLKAQPGASLNFDGGNDYVNCGNAINAVLDPLNVITVEAWVYPTTTSGLAGIVGNYSTPLNEMQFMLRRDGNNYTFFVNDGTYRSVTSISTVTLNTWVHIAGVWDGSQIRIYVNGILEATTLGVGGPSFVTTTNFVSIGGQPAGGGEFFRGNIDEVRIWKKVLTRCEINTNMNTEILTTATGLLANYHFNQGFPFASNPSATSLPDVAGSSYNGTLNNFTLNGATSNWSLPAAVPSAIAAPTPTNLTVNNGTLCLGSSFTIAPTPAGNYTLSSGSPIVSPTANTTYTVTGTVSYGGCVFTTTTAILSVTVLTLPLPVITVTANTSPVCIGQELKLTGSGGVTYFWSLGFRGTEAYFHPASTGTYTITGYDALGCKNTANITVPAANCTGINDPNALVKNLQVYPNPSNGEFTLELNNGSEKNIEVLDVTGKVVLTIASSELDKTNVNLNQLSNGIYFVKVTSDHATNMIKVVKQ